MSYFFISMFLLIFVIMKKKAIWIYILLSVLVVLTIASVIGFNYAYEPYNGDSQWIKIDSNSDEISLRDSLKVRLGNEFGNKVYLMWSFFGGNTNNSVGAYKIDSGMTAVDISKKIVRNYQTPVKVVFNNIRTFEQLSERISAKMMFSEQEFNEACDSVLSNEGLVKEEYVSVFFPDSYEFYWTSSATSFVQKMLGYYQKFWNEDRINKAKGMGLTPVEVSTLASIVEEETNKADERPLVARLYLNRIKKGMKLQADPTVKFAIGDFSLRRITHKHLTITSPYNTYMYEGLPPGPIRIVSKKTVDAVLNAPKHDYIYMCAKEDFSGYHNFASDYASHLSNAKRYQTELNRRKIK